MNDVATTTERKKAHPLVVIKGQIEEREHEFARALPAHIPVERFKRVVLTAVQNNPGLLNADRQSFFNACMRSAQDGLLPDGREGAIVLYGNKAQWMPMVFGILKKIRNSGELASIVARVVYAGDKFRYWIDDSGEHVEYEPSDNPDTNIVRRVFAVAKTKAGEIYVEPMSVEQIEKVRSISRAKNNGPWVEWWDQMAIKTALRRLAKRLPMSSDLDDLLRRDDDLYDLHGAADQTVKGPRPALVDALDQLAQPTQTQAQDAEIVEEQDETSPADQKKSESAKAATPAPQQAAEPEKAGAPGSIVEPPPTFRDADEYIGWARAQIEDADDPDVLEAWWKSAEQKSLRSKLGVEVDTATEVGAEVKARASELRQAGS